MNAPKEPSAQVSSALTTAMTTYTENEIAMKCEAYRLYRSQASPSTPERGLMGS
jgi:hypothetical protein